LHSEGLEILLEIYNDILGARLFLDDWKKYKAFFIPKNDKTNIRPISMASCVLQGIKTNHKRAHILVARKEL
jgi:hypothetical protein